MLDKHIEELQERVDKLEKDSHPPIGLCEFEGYKDLVKRIEALEAKLIESSDD